MDFLCHVRKWVFFQISWGCQVIAAYLAAWCNRCHSSQYIHKGLSCSELMSAAILYRHRSPQLPFSMVRTSQLDQMGKKHSWDNHFSIFGLFSSNKYLNIFKTRFIYLKEKLHMIILVYRDYNIRMCGELRAPNCCSEVYAWNKWKKCQWDKNNDLLQCSLKQVIILQL